jgi:antitoxin HigA-1
MTKHLAPVSPGEMLAEEFLNPIGMSKYRLAKSIGVPAQRIGDISADTDLRLCRFFGLSDGWWLRLQAGHDTVMAKRGMAAELERIVPLERAA